MKPREERVLSSREIRGNCHHMRAPLRSSPVGNKRSVKTDREFVKEIESRV
jgi:hypothetical protein